MQLLKFETVSSIGANTIPKRAAAQLSEISFKSYNSNLIT